MEQHKNDVPFELKAWTSKNGFAHWGSAELADYDVLLGELGVKRQNNIIEFEPDQLMARYGLESPTNLVELDACIEALNLAKEFTLRTILNDALNIDSLLDANALSSLKQVTDVFKEGSTESLLDLLVFPAFLQWQPEDIIAWPITSLATLLESPKAQALGKHLLAELDWYGGANDQTPSAVLLAKLIWKAIALDLDPNSDLCGFDIDQSTHWGKSYSTLNHEIERFIETSTKALSPTTAQLAIWVLKPNYPAGLNIKGVPAQLAHRRSSAWLHLQHGINLAEALEVGLSSRMNYQELENLSAKVLKNSTPEQQAFASAAMNPPLVDWAETRGLIQAKPENGYADADINRAFSSFMVEEKKLEDAIVQLQQKIPDRLNMAQQLLAQEKIAPDTIFLDRSGRSDEFIRANGIGFAFNTSLRTHRLALDLVASGLLSGPSPDWMPPLIKMDEDFYPDFNVRYKNLPNIAAQFETDFERWHVATTSALETITHALLDDLPLEERLAIEQGHVELFTLRKNNHDGLSPTSKGPAVNVMLNTPRNNDLLVANYGFILYSRHGGNSYFHELFPYAGFLQRRDDLSTPAGLRDIKNKLDNRTPSLIPFDWAAYSTGSAPVTAPESMAVLHHLATYPVPASGARTRQKLLAYAITCQAICDIKARLYKIAKGTTAFDKPDPTLAFLKAYIIPVWGPFENLAESAKSPRSAAQILLGTLLLLIDIVSLVLPFAKVVSLTFRFANKAATFGLRSALPSLGLLSKGVVVTSYQVLSPLSGAYDFLKFAGKKTVALKRASFNAVRLGVEESRVLLASHLRFQKRFFSLSSQDVKTWKDLDSRYRLLDVDGHSNVLIYGQPTRGGNYLLDPTTHRPYGSALMQVDDAGRFSRHVPSELMLEHQEGALLLLDMTPDLTKHWVRWGDDLFLEAGGVTYKKIRREDGTTVLKRTRPLKTVDHLGPLEELSCRAKRAPDALVKCADNIFKNVGHSNATAARTTGVDTAPWFTDISVTAATDTGRVVHGRQIYEIKNNRLMAKLDTSLIQPKDYKKTITVNIIGGNDIFKQINIADGIVDGIKDTRIVSAVVAKRKINGSKVIVTQADEGIYYFGNFFDDRPLQLNRIQVNTKNVTDKTNLSEEHYLVYIYNGSYDANRYIKTLGPEVIEADLKAIKRDLIAGKETHVNKFIGGPFDMGTTPEQGALFCKYTQDRAVITARLNRPSWSVVDLQTPINKRENIAAELNTLYLSPTRFTPENITKLSTTQLLTPEKKNFAYVKITAHDPNMPTKVYYSLSGIKKTHLDLPLTKQIDKGTRFKLDGWKMEADGIPVSPGKTRYINAQRTKNKIGIGSVDPHEALFLPDLTSGFSSNHRMMDSEHMILNRINADKIDFTKVQSIEVYSTFPTCQSCTAGLMGLKLKVPNGEFTVFEGGKL